MKKVLLLTALMLLCSAWVVAQSGSGAGSATPSQTGSPTSSQTSDNSSMTTIEGCLAGSAGSFTLTDSSGKTYSLQGESSKLSSEVGHQVRIKGSESAGSATGTNPSSAAGNPSGSAASGASAAINFDVKSVRKVSDTCTPPSK